MQQTTTTIEIPVLGVRPRPQGRLRLVRAGSRAARIQAARETLAFWAREFQKRVWKPEFQQVVDTQVSPFPVWGN